MMSSQNNVSDTEIVVYQVQPGDNLSSILRRYFGPGAAAQAPTLLRDVLAENPHIKNANAIYPGQLVKLSIPLQYCPAPDNALVPELTFDLDQQWFPVLQRNWVTASKEEQQMQLGLAKVMLGTGSANLAMVDRTFRSNAPLLRNIAENYEAYKRGEISKGQYDYRRGKLISQLDAKLGPFSRAINGRKSSREVLRISRKAGAVPTEPIVQQISKMNTVSKVASRGGVALSVMGVGLACYEIAQAPSTQSKNEIFVEALGGLAGGAIAAGGVALAALFFATPAGWITALAIGVSGTLGGMAVGAGAKRLYNRYGAHLDIAGRTGVTSICVPKIRGERSKQLLSFHSQSVL